MILTSTTTTAITKRMWMKPPRVYEVTNPRIHNITKIAAMVKSMSIVLSYSCLKSNGALPSLEKARRDHNIY
jgi:hypothetical protein